MNTTDRELPEAPNFRRLALECAVKGDKHGDHATYIESALKTAYELGLARSPAAIDEEENWRERALQAERHLSEERSNFDRLLESAKSAAHERGFNEGKASCTDGSASTTSSPASPTGSEPGTTPSAPTPPPTEKPEEESLPPPWSHDEGLDLGFARSATETELRVKLQRANETRHALKIKDELGMLTTDATIIRLAQQRDQFQAELAELKAATWVLWNENFSSSDAKVWDRFEKALGPDPDEEPETPRELPHVRAPT